jgi:phosphate transport system protein
METAMNPQTHEHIVRSLDQDQQRLFDEVARMGTMAAGQLESALDLLDRPDEGMAARIIANDAAIDALERAINQDVLQLALRGPLARDLRELLAALRIAADIERVGDLAANLAKRSRALAPAAPHARVDLEALGRRAVAQLRAALDAYRLRDAAAAQRVRADDAELDLLHTGLFHELLAWMREDPAAVVPGTHLVFMAKNLERIGDHATNIAESVCFLVEGDDDLPPREKRDATSLPDIR